MKSNTALPRRLCAWRELALAAIILVSVSLASPKVAAGGNPGPVKPAYSAVYVIGDSLSDTGRLAALLGGAAPISMVNGRLSNGPLWIDYVSPALGVPYDPLTNFSWAGAFTGRGNAWAGLPGMLDELDELLAPLGAKKHLPKDALYIVFGGSNDFFRILDGSENPFAVIPAGVQNVTAIVTALHERGARHIVVMDLPDIGLTPRALLAGPAAAGQATVLSLYFNTLLHDALGLLEFPVIRVSPFALLRAIAADPGAYGFSNTTGLGILDLPNAHTYLFWDDVHPTTRTHALLAAQVLDAIQAAVGEPGLSWRGAQGFFWSRIDSSSD